jgi:hypothetical protein
LKIYIHKKPTDAILSFRCRYSEKRYNLSPPSWHLYPKSQFSWWRAPFIKPIANEEGQHTIYKDYANQWKLNEGDIERLRESGDYSEASGVGANGLGASEASPDVADGKARLVLYFLPQSYFYYGLVISITTLVTLLFLMGRGWWKGMRECLNVNNSR